MTEEKSKKILVADDEEDLLGYLVNTLKRTNCEIFSTTKGREALSLAKREKPDLIILDVVMPDMDGGQVASALKANPSTAHIPVIFLTGILTKEEGFDVGMTGGRFVIPKPVQPAELLDKISRVMPFK
ncbi:MAG: response regulator [Candidatus Omnitrophica bacterium]|nr:response regulator [Candidatus Omnitrophota bacterium]